MATTDSILTEARYDLRDTNSTLFPDDDELFYYANRGLRQLDNVLSALNSDWVYNEASLSLSAADNYVAVPSNCMVVRSAWISTSELDKVKPEIIYEHRKWISATGQPLLFAEVGTNLQFEYTADDNYTVKAYYDKRATALSTGNDMPYNDEFNDAIREMIVTLAHKRQDNDVTTDSAIYNFFMEKLGGNIRRRNHTPAGARLDF